MEVAMSVVREDLIWCKARRWKCAFLQTADIWASNVSLESRITSRVVTLPVVGKTDDAIETSWMTGNDYKHRDEPRRVASDFMGLLAALILCGKPLAYVTLPGTCSCHIWHTSLCHICIYHSVFYFCLQGVILVWKIKLLRYICKLRSSISFLTFW